MSVGNRGGERIWVMFDAAYFASRCALSLNSLPYHLETKTPDALHRGLRSTRF